ncbi:MULTISPECIES: CvfD/Ygs/GSP13 family RNA-binding post-transcriptional regulator [Leuconostoc]|uniref:S1 RNA-binding domain-containing protein n=1 Tax=Leuconostoc holzapfelii TaxID=434464 RepID=A0A846ZC39_9LACO|nr:CvfD/Ygs/GSP13 family RNA-binding post-transcriptional regulator [Leuconostoc holzapfelii]NKZ19026.1 S1 RNA-binding domain-containing protein [Leuconostoc holzapfelii]
MTYHIGQKLKGRITGIQPYGAFVMLDDHTQGLIHISECRSGVVRDLKNELEIGKEVVVTVLDIEQYTNKISLSLRQDSLLPLPVLPKNINLRKHFWTNNYLNYGFAPIAEHRDQWVAEALARIGQ